MKITFSTLTLILFSSLAVANTYNCKATSSVYCDKQNCSKEPTSSVEFTISETKADIAMYSVAAVDYFPVIKHSKNSVGFLFNANGYSLSGEYIEILASGHIYPNMKFSALIDSVHFEGTCQF